jgi:hypothetical protein
MKIYFQVVKELSLQVHKEIKKGLLQNKGLKLILRIEEITKVKSFYSCHKILIMIGLNSKLFTKRIL